VEAHQQTLDRRPLKKMADSTMVYGEVGALDKKISRLVMGMDNQTTISHAAAMFDDFFARGGNCFDSAHIYGGGRQETLFGQWHSNRNIRDEVVLISKGAHSPRCFPDDLKEQFAISLDRLQTDYVDIYFIHRDNPDVPVGEFVDVLNQLHDKGQIGVFGGSNWTVERLEQANDYARGAGKQGFDVLSNNFSLAQMVKPVWPGCIASSTPAFMGWLADHRMPLFSWSSQARGFFVPGRAGPDKQDDRELVDSWYSTDNFTRQARCFELAKQKSVQPISVALAYVLLQPFPVFPLIGPRQISETVTSFEALDVNLTEKELSWLNLEADENSIRS
jgi:aryl-alcohol dehydrogenase-like predicted oxidoreductase